MSAGGGDAGDNSKREAGGMVRCPPGRMGVDRWPVALERGGERFLNGPTALAFAVGGAEDVGLGGEHHVVEGLGKHGGGEECDGAESFGAGIDEVVPQGGGQDKDAAGTDWKFLAAFDLQFAGARNDVLALLGCVGVPAEAAAGFDFVDDGGGLGSAVASV